MKFGNDEAMVQEEDYCAALENDLPPTTGGMLFWLRPVIKQIAVDAVNYNDLLQRDNYTQRRMKNKREKRGSNVIRQHQRPRLPLEP